MREDWVECTFEDVFELITNGSSIKQTDDKNGIPVSRIETIWNETIDWSRVKYAIDYDDNLHNKYLLKNGDILFSHINSDSHLGKTAIFKDFKKLIHGINLLLLRPFSILNSTYILYYLRFTKYSGGFLQIAQRSVNQSSINQSSLKQLKISLPPLPEQRAIVKKIEALFSSLDAGIADLKKAQDQLKIYRQAVLKKAFEGELTKEWREQNNLIFDWEETFSGKVMTDINSGSTPKSQFLSSGSGDIQFLKVYNLNFNGTINLLKEPAFIPNDIHLNQNRRAISRGGDVLINIVGPPLGKVSMIPMNDTREYSINQAIVRFRPNEKISPKFLSWFMQNPITINWLEGTSKATAGQYNVKVTTCREIPMLLPPIDEQAQIVKEIESRLSVCDAVEQQIKDSLTQAEALRQSILKKAFEGRLLTEEEIKACQQEPDYEPASVLLEKIKAEKEVNKTVKKSKKK